MTGTEIYNHIEQLAAWYNEYNGNNEQYSYLIIESNGAVVFHYIKYYCSDTEEWNSPEIPFESTEEDVMKICEEQQKKMALENDKLLRRNLEQKKQELEWKIQSNTTELEEVKQRYEKLNTSNHDHE